MSEKLSDTVRGRTNGNLTQRGSTKELGHLMAQLDVVRESGDGLHNGLYGVWLAARWVGVVGTRDLSI